ncbi:hypothetical protein SASPL_117651 [Salvia splendens]|uniref:PHD finger protein ALFIN-LIKE n=1 Tax=Salvia splendens TaxID=180675 RepID=A0A8X8XYR5_SALSN|nr:hypothetical protein SASPL_117651 [Salvia splendens]
MLTRERGQFRRPFNKSSVHAPQLFSLFHNNPIPHFHTITHCSVFLSVMDGASVNNPRTVEEVFKDFKGRRNALIKALTTEVEEFFQQCDPGELDKENLCLFGLPTEQWEVNLPAEEVPPELPEPALGINFARDGMPEKDWLALVAVHSDAWLLSVAFYFGARFGFDKADRKRLFNMINDLPTIFEVVTGAAKKQVKDKSSISNHSGSASKSNPKLVNHYTFKVGLEMNKARPLHPSFWSSYYAEFEDLFPVWSPILNLEVTVSRKFKLLPWL